MQFLIIPNNIQKDFGISTEVFYRILDYFVERKLIKKHPLMSAGRFNISIEVNAHDLVAHGGFKGQEELLKKNIQKLILEIESLKPSIPDKVEKITSIVSGISAGLALFMPK